MCEMSSAYKILVGNPEGERPFGRPGRRWGDNIRVGLREIGWEIVDLIYLTEDRDQWRVPVNTVMNFRIHKRRGIS
jgi:hypothetical protein